MFRMFNPFVLMPCLICLYDVLSMICPLRVPVWAKILLSLVLACGLLKIFLKRFLHISILKNIRTPLHDDVRRRLQWSDTQTVNRFAALQILLALLTAAVLL